MNWDQVEGKWKQVKGSAKAKWGKMTDNDLEIIAGRREQLVGKLQEIYGLDRRAAQESADGWLKTVKEDSMEHAADPHYAGKR